MDPGFLAMMPDSVTIEPLSSRDTYGKPTYGTGVVYQARVVRKRKAYRRKDGTEAASSSVVYLGGVSGATEQSRITLPDVTQPVIGAVNLYPDELGAHHEVIYLE